MYWLNRHGYKHVLVKRGTGPGMYRLNGAWVQACTGKMVHGARHASVKWCAGPGMCRLNGARAQACTG